MATMVKQDPAAQGYPMIIPGYYAARPGIQIGTQLPRTATAEDMQFARQMGIEWVMTDVPAGEAGVEAYRDVVRHFAEGGLKVYRLGNHSVHNMEEVTLNLPGRDAKIAEYLAYIRAWARRASTTPPTPTWPTASGAPSVSRCAAGRWRGRFACEQAETGYWIEKQWHAPLSHERPYTEDELWDNYAYFIRQVVPVAEEAGVYIGIHPDDPPVYPWAGCRAASSATSRATGGRSRSPTARTSACACAWAAGWRAAPPWANRRGGDHPLLRRAA